MNPLKGYYFPETGEVQKGDFVCNLHTTWEKADGLIGSKLIDGHTTDHFQTAGGWRVCRPIKKKRKSIPVIKGVLARAGLSVSYPYRQSRA